jgi:hypothetical protein
MTHDDAQQGFPGLIRLQELFDEDPSIENYVRLRRLWRVDTEIYRFADVDLVQKLGDDLERANLTRALVHGALGGDDREIDELCLQLMERLIERKRLEANGETHLQARGKGISDALIGHLIVAMMEVLQQDGLEPSSSLVLLIREQLGGANTEIYKSHRKWVGRNRALFLGMQMGRRGEQPTNRKIAELMKIQPSTVSRWFPAGDFPERVEKFGRSLRLRRDKSMG